MTTIERARNFAAGGHSKATESGGKQGLITLVYLCIQASQNYSNNAVVSIVGLQ